MTIDLPPVSSPAWTSRTKRIVALICLLIIGVILWQVTDILPIVAVALVLSYLLNPFTTWIDRHILSRGRPDESHRGFAIVITFILLIVILALVGVLVVPMLINQLQEFLRRIPELVETIGVQVNTFLSQPIIIANQRIVPMESLSQALGTGEGELAIPLENMNIPEAASGFARSLTGPAFSFLGGAFNAVLNLVFLLTLMFYLIKDGSAFAHNVVEITPQPYKSDTRRMLYELSQVWDAYLRGQLTLSLAMGGLVFIAATLLGVPNAPILGLLSGLFEFIPTLGPLLALIPAALLALASQSSTIPGLEGATFALVVVAVWTLLQNIEAVVLVPRVMGDSLNLHPFVVMVGVLAGASLGGALGVILAAPVVASLRVIGMYIYGKLTDKNPFPPAPTVTQEMRMRRSSLAYRFSLALRYSRLWLVRLGQWVQRRVRGRRTTTVVRQPHPPTPSPLPREGEPEQSKGAKTDV